MDRAMAAARTPPVRLAMALAAALVALAGPGSARAQAWTQAPGHVYLKLAYGSATAGEQYSFDGRAKLYADDVYAPAFFDRSVYLYTEAGLLPHLSGGASPASPPRWRSAPTWRRSSRRPACPPTARTTTGTRTTCRASTFSCPPLRRGGFHLLRTHPAGDGGEERFPCRVTQMPGSPAPAASTS